MDAPIVGQRALEPVEMRLESVVKVERLLQIVSVLARGGNAAAHLYDQLSTVLNGRIANLFVLILVEEATVLVNYNFVIRLIIGLKIRLIGRLPPERVKNEAGEDVRELNFCAFSRFSVGTLLFINKIFVNRLIEERQRLCLVNFGQILES